jgi:PIN domain nuclease of toxin-antitoxin system
MNLLLDTQVALWALTGSARLSARARELILAPEATVFYSAATVWEIAIKHRLARGDMPVSGKDAANLFLEAGYMELHVTAAHAAATEGLPLHHADPFDRILVAQAHYAPLRLLTHDQQLLAYGGPIEFV